jgi:hypothetical protein
VADWFAGSGTTAAVAQRTGRRFIAVDRSAEAIALAYARLVAQGRRMAESGAPPHDLVVERLAVQPMPPSGARQPPMARGKTRDEAGA